MTLHCASVDENSPECVSCPKRAGKESYLYGWGPNEYVPTGSLGNFEYIDRLGEIHCPCLIFSGSEDLCTPSRMPAPCIMAFPEAGGNCWKAPATCALWTVTKTIAASWSPGWRNRTAGINQNWLAF